MGSDARSIGARRRAVGGAVLVGSHLPLIYYSGYGAIARR